MGGLFDRDSPRTASWLDLLADPPRPQSAPGGIFGLPTESNALFGLESLFASARRRTEWNHRLSHWERPASVTETGTIERARNLVSNVVAGNRWLSDQGVTVAGQGSYHNNTNVRTEADIDLRVVHPDLKIEYGEGVQVSCARSVLRYNDTGRTFEQVFTGLRTALATDLRSRFGYANVDVGNKAIRIKGITGSRAEVDIVPAVRFHYVNWLPAYSRYSTVEGLAILGRDDQWTLNFPEQHALNGIAKRSRTACRFKKVVRVFKRLRSELKDSGILSVSIPSFLVECLVYSVEDTYFLVEADDRYDRARRVARRMQQLLIDPAAAATLNEINEAKMLFHVNQAWSHADALAFVNAAVGYLGDI